MSFSKKLGQFKQWTGEKFGSSGRTQMPEEFKRLEEDTEARKDCIEKLHSCLVAYLKTFDKKRVNKVDTFLSKHIPIEAFGTNLVLHGKLIGSDSALGENIIKVGEFERQLASYQTEFISKAKSAYLVHLDSLIDLLKQYSDLKKKLKARRLDYDAKYNRMQKSKKEKPEYEEELKTAQTKFEESLNDMQNLMETFAVKEETLATHLSFFLEAQRTYYQRCSDTLNTAVTNLKENYTSKTDLRLPHSLGSKTDLRLTPNMTAASKSDPDLRQVKSVEGGKRWTLANSGDLIQTKDTESNSNDSATLCSIGKSQPQEPTIKIVQALYSFTAQNDDELSFTKGEKIDVIETVDENWSLGKINSGAVGVFPMNYVEELKVKQQEESSPPRPLEPKNSNLSSGSLSSSKGPPPSYIESTNKLSLNDSKAIQNNDTKPTSIPNGTAVSTRECRDCGCNDYSPNVFKSGGSCNNCFHKH